MLEDRIRFQQVAYFRATGKLPPPRLINMAVRTLIRAKRSYPEQIDALLDVCSNMRLDADNLLGATETSKYWHFRFNVPLKPKAVRW